MENQDKLKCLMWEQTKDRDEKNIVHSQMNDKVSFISIPIEENNLSCTEEPHPKRLDDLKSRISFKGNIRLSSSGLPWNIFRNELEDTEFSLL